VHDDNWLKGQTIAVMMNNSFLCSLWQLSRAATEKLPWLISAMSAAACVGQVVFQAGMIPLVYTRWGTWFVGIWGTAFALVSFVLLQISYVPSTECVLWALVFSPARVIIAIVRGVGSRMDGRQVRWQSLPFAASVAATALGAFLLVAVVTAGHHFPSVAVFRKAAKYIGPRLYYLGLDVPDVFNRLDLSTDKYWYVLERRDRAGRITRVPVALADGSREYYHWFDTLYFDNFLPWRRMMGLHCGDPRVLLVPGKGCYELIRRVIRFDRRLHRLGAETDYLVTVYGSKDMAGRSEPQVVKTLFFRDGTRVVQSGKSVH
jgi:hypothetical protein